MKEKNIVLMAITKRKIVTLIVIMTVIGILIGVSVSMLLVSGQNAESDKTAKNTITNDIQTNELKLDAMQYGTYEYQETTSFGGGNTGLYPGSIQNTYTIILYEDNTFGIGNRYLILEKKKDIYETSLDSMTYAFGKIRIEQDKIYLDFENTDILNTSTDTILPINIKDNVLETILPGNTEKVLFSRKW